MAYIKARKRSNKKGYANDEIRKNQNTTLPPTFGELVGQAMQTRKTTGKPAEVVFG